MRRRTHLQAISDELDDALASLQTARRLLAEVRRTGDDTVDDTAVDGEPALSPPPSTSLRYAGMTVAQAAAELAIGEEQVRRLLRRGELEGVSFGGKAGWRLDPRYVRATAAAWQASRQAQEELRRSSRPPSPRSRAKRRT